MTKIIIILFLQTTCVFLCERGILNCGGIVYADILSHTIAKLQFNKVDIRNGRPILPTRFPKIWNYILLAAGSLVSINREVCTFT
ncbi:unnamed protein product [Meloidogyne enterolobii]|uniref:Uncharacterized protein n=1 Tax=Meloidogyne enterolobii TaxID=390850 RepID=A0ACB0XZH8_MELEN